MRQPGQAPDGASSQPATADPQLGPQPRAQPARLSSRTPKSTTFTWAAGTRAPLPAVERAMHQSSQLRPGDLLGTFPRGPAGLASTIRLHRAPITAVPTCHLLPPPFPALHRPWEPGCWAALCGFCLSASTPTPASDQQAGPPASRSATPSANQLLPTRFTALTVSQGHSRTSGGLPGLVSDQGTVNAAAKMRLQAEQGGPLGPTQLL